MVDLVTVSAGIVAATKAVGLIDKIWDQVDKFISGRPEPEVPKQHRLTIERDGDVIVSRNPDGSICQRITADQLQKLLTESQFKHLNVLEQSMENHYTIWSSVYPQLALAVDPIAKAQTEQKLRQIVAAMKGDLDGILQFLEDCGLQLDDHYLHIRDVAKSA